MRSAIMLTLVMVLGLAQSSWAFRMYGPGGQFMNSSDPISSSPSLPDQGYSSQKSKTKVQKLYEEHHKNREREKKEEASVDLTGIRWSKGRESYEGLRNFQTEKLGYRAGRYVLSYHYSGNRYFGIKMYSRRHDNYELLVNRVGGIRQRMEMTLPYDDELWFRVNTPRGNWSLSFERVGD